MGVGDDDSAEIVSLGMGVGDEGGGAFRFFFLSIYLTRPASHSAFSSSPFGVNTGTAIALLVDGSKGTITNRVVAIETGFTPGNNTSADIETSIDFPESLIYVICAESSMLYFRGFNKSSFGAFSLAEVKPSTNAVTQCIFPSPTLLLLE